VPYQPTEQKAEVVVKKPDNTFASASSSE